MRVTGLVEAGGEPCFRDGNANGITEALSERAGSHFDSDGVAAFRMAGSFAAPLTETLEFIKRKIVTGEMQQAVEQHGAMAGGEHETVTIKPVRDLWD